MYKRVMSALMIGILCILAVGRASATTISDLKQRQQETQAQLDAMTGSLTDLEDEKSGVDAEIGDLNAQIMEILASISLMEEDIAAMEEQIAQAEVEYQAAVKDEQTQYEAMKKRIRFMYEKGDQTYAQLFFESKSLSDMLNKAEYIEKLYEYDRAQLKRFQETKEKVAALKNKLEDDKAELEAQKFELEEEKAASEEMLAEMKEASADYEVQIAQVRQSAAQYKALIKQQASIIKQMEEEERRKAEEEARRRAEAEKKKNGSSDENTGSQTYKKTAAAASFNVGQIDSAAGSAKGKEVAKFACQFIGNPYVAGGTSLTSGADCSGFTQSVYKNFGYSIPRNSASQRAYGSEVSLDAAEPGDIVCYAGHVALYIGNGLIVHASTQRTGIKISNVNYRPVLSVRRVV